MKKIILSVLSIALLSSCSSTYYQYQNKENRKNISVAKDKVNVRNFDLQLVEARVGSRTSADNLKSDFLNTADMKKIMLEVINNSLKQNNYAGNSKDSYQYDIRISASRVFSAFSSNKYVGFNIEGIQIDVYKDGNFVAKKYLEGSKPSLMGGGSPTIQCGQNRGLIGNLKSIGKTIAHTKDSQDELEDVQRCASTIYSSMIILGQ
jgi:hypothetical protein